MEAEQTNEEQKIAQDLASQGWGWARSLSTKLLALTALWVTFIVGIVGYTMYLSSVAEESAAVVNLVSTMKTQIYRANRFTEPAYSQELFQQEIDYFDLGMRNLAKPQSWGGLNHLRDESYAHVFDQLNAQWHDVVRPQLLAGRKAGAVVKDQSIDRFIANLGELGNIFAADRNDLLWLIRYIQLLVAAMAIGSLFVIMWLLLRWVIRPTETLGLGLEQISAGRLNTRVELGGSTEFETISEGFNRMADRLEDLVENLEAKVKEKTAAVEENNRNLGQLYELTTYFGRQHSVDEACEGFCTRMMSYTKADACSVYIMDKNSTQLELAASAELPREMFAKVSMSPVLVDSVQSALDADLPLRVSADDPPSTYGLLSEGSQFGFETTYIFHIRSGTKSLGLMLLHYKEPTTLDAPRYLLYESFGSHLGVAVDNLRLIERDQQYAVIQERNLMAQGLHDSIAQSLSFLNLQVQLLEQGLQNKDEGLISDSLKQIKAGVQESYEDVRELLLNFRERLHNETFIEAINTVISRFKLQSKIDKVDLKIDRQGGPELSARQKLQVIFIMQEALANVRKHAQATHLVINITNGADFTVAVNDNGVGIDPVLVAQRSKRHVGLNIMQERADKIGAKVEIGKPDPALFAHGTRVKLTIPASQRGVS